MLDIAPRYHHRIVYKLNIILHKFVIITSITLVPLLAWHLAAAGLLEEDETNPVPLWHDRFIKVSFRGPRAVVWAGVWIMTWLDFAVAFYLLSRLQGTHSNPQPSRHRTLLCVLSPLYDVFVIAVFITHIILSISAFTEETYICHTIALQSVPNYTASANQTLVHPHSEPDAVSSQEKCLRGDVSLRVSGIVACVVVGFVSGVHGVVVLGKISKWLFMELGRVDGGDGEGSGV